MKGLKIERPTYINTFLYVQILHHKEIAEKKNLKFIQFWGITFFQCKRKMCKNKSSIIEKEYQKETKLISIKFLSIKNNKKLITQF